MDAHVCLFPEPAPLKCEVTRASICRRGHTSKQVQAVDGPAAPGQIHAEERRGASLFIGVAFARMHACDRASLGLKMCPHTPHYVRPYALMHLHVHPYMSAVSHVGHVSTANRSWLSLSLSLSFSLSLSLSLSVSLFIHPSIPLSIYTHARARARAHTHTYTHRHRAR